MHTDNAVKTIEKAIPTVNAEGLVIKWDIEVKYELNDYPSVFSVGVDVEPSKAPADYTKAELWALAKEPHLDAVYESQYVSVKLAEPAAVETISDFDVESLA